MKEGMEILKTSNLCVGYGNKVIVGPIDQTFFKGEFVCILGPNGAGKTTILKTLANLIKPINGVVYLKGKNVYEYRPADFARSVSIVLTGHLSPGLITVFEFVAMGRYPYTNFFGRLSQEDVLKVEESLDLVHARHLADRYFNELSDGERQKVVFARALAQEPDLIILDEPTIHLDLKHRIELIGVLRQSCKEKGISVIVSLHDIDLALRIAERVVLVKNGEVVACGEPDEVLNEEMVTKLYDLDIACFNTHLGTIDIINNNKNGKRVFVIGGGGTGVSVYRALIKRNMHIITGVIHENDIDFFIARSLGATVISEKPFSVIREDSIKKSLRFIKEVDFVIDSGFPIGESNRHNIELIKRAILSSCKVFSLREKEELLSILGEITEKVVLCNRISEIYTKHNGGSL